MVSGGLELLPGSDAHVAPHDGIRGLSSKPLNAAGGVPPDSGVVLGPLGAPEVDVHAGCGGGVADDEVPTGGVGEQDQMADRGGGGAAVVDDVHGDGFRAEGGVGVRTGDGEWPTGRPSDGAGGGGGAVTPVDGGGEVRDPRRRGWRR